MTTVSTEASRCAAPISRPTLGNTPAPHRHLKSQGTIDSIQTHARAVNSLRMALHYLNQPESNVPGAGRKAVQALAAINVLRTSSLGEAANDSGRVGQ